MLAVTSPKYVSFASIAILQESASSMGWSVEILLKGVGRFRKSLKQIRELYELAGNPSVKPALISEGAICTEVRVNDATAKQGGMGFEFRYVPTRLIEDMTNHDNVQKGRIIQLPR